MKNITFLYSFDPPNPLSIIGAGGVFLLFQFIRVTE
jgi:hypothetical protein